LKNERNKRKLPEAIQPMLQNRENGSRRRKPKKLVLKADATKEKSKLARK
jgi:hypothetical protein